MTKAEIVTEIAKKTGIEKKDVLNTIEAFMEAVKESLTKDQYLLYKLIWTRFLASQMTAAIFDSMQVTIENGIYALKANGSRVIFDGYQRVYSSNIEADKDKILPELTC
mgnify:CR=1 FL=1